MYINHINIITARKISEASNSMMNTKCLVNNRKKTPRETASTGCGCVSDEIIYVFLVFSLSDSSAAALLFYDYLQRVGLWNFIVDYLFVARKVVATVQITVYIKTQWL